MVKSYFSNRNMTSSSNPFDFFGEIKCINIPEAKDRREEMEKEFNRLGILDRIQWQSREINPIVLEYFRQFFEIDIFKKQYYDYKFSLQIEKLDCHINHLSCILHSCNNPKGHLLIFEDDVMFKEFDDDIFTNIPEDWDMFFLGGHPASKLKKTSNKILKIEGAFYNAQAYAINVNSLFRIKTFFFEDLKQRNIIMNYDYYFKYMYNKFKMYCAYPPFAYQKDGYSYRMKKNKIMVKNNKIDNAWNKYKN